VSHRLGRWVTFALLLSGGVGRVLLADPSEVWQQGVTALKANDPKAAQTAFEEWAKAFGPEASRSPEYHYNLGIANWELKQAGSAVFHLLQSTQGYLSPWNVHSTLKTVSGIQRELGIRENPVEDWLFRWPMLLASNLVSVLLSLGFWGLLAAFLVRSLQGARATRAAVQIAVLPGLCFVIGLSALALKAISPNWSVLVDEENGVHVYKMPQAIEENRLVDLPSGTVVLTGRTERGYTEIQSPVAGWVVSTLSLDPRVIR